MPFLIVIEWSNPYTEPPDGRPRTLAAVVVPATAGGGAPLVPPELRALWKPGDGYCAGFCRLDDKPRRKLSAAAKFSIRRKRLKARIEKRWPLFAEQMIAEAMQRKPSYYGLEVPT